MKHFILFVVMLGVVAAGCGSAEPVVTKAQEKAFRNPPKTMPAAASEGMKQGMAEAKKKSEDQNTSKLSNK